MKPNVMHRMKVSEWMENIFDILYLSFTLTAALIYFDLFNSQIEILLYGFLALVLGAGDAFHLIPRMLVNAQGEREDSARWLGNGQKVTSITMTVFYVILFQIWQLLYPDLPAPLIVTILVYALAVLRIVICFFPQNEWTDGKGNLKWSLYRNIPFLIMGILIAMLFIWSGITYDDGFRWMSLAIIISFACYLPVTLLAKKYPKVGMLMIPKTCAYIWMLVMGFSLIWG